MKTGDKYSNRKTRDVATITHLGSLSTPPMDRVYFYLSNAMLNADSSETEFLAEYRPRTHAKKYEVAIEDRPTGGFYMRWVCYVRRYGAVVGVGTSNLSATHAFRRAQDEARFRNHAARDATLRRLLKPHELRTERPKD